MVDRTSATVTPLIAPYVTPYKIDVVQGNVVTREQLAALKIGMPRAQVPGVVGTSLLVSVFHANRWDYVFSFKRKGGDMESRRVTLWFEADKLARIEADELPSEAEFVASLKGVQAPGAGLERIVDAAGGAGIGLIAATALFIALVGDEIRHALLLGREDAAQMLKGMNLC